MKGVLLKKEYLSDTCIHSREIIICRYSVLQKVTPLPNGPTAHLFVYDLSVSSN